MKKILSLICVGVMVLFGGVAMVGCGKIRDPGGDFAYDRVMVYMTYDKDWTPADFSGFAFSKIRDREREAQGITYSVDFYTFYLTEPSRDNVLRAIYYLKKIPEVERAEIIGTVSGA